MAGESKRDGGTIERGVYTSRFDDRYYQCTCSEGRYSFLGLTVRDEVNVLYFAVVPYRVVTNTVHINCRDSR